MDPDTFWIRIQRFPESRSLFVIRIRIQKVKKQEIKIIIAQINLNLKQLVFFIAKP